MIILYFYNYNLSIFNFKYSKKSLSIDRLFKTILGYFAVLAGAIAGTAGAFGAGVTALALATLSAGDSSPALINGSEAFLPVFTS